MSHNHLFRAGEASVPGPVGQFTGAITEVLIGDVSGPVGQAFANLVAQNVGYIQPEPGQAFNSVEHMMGQAKGYNRLFAVRASNQMVRPATIVICKSSLRNNIFEKLYGGVVQPAVADAVLDAVEEDYLPRQLADSLCIIALVWLDPACADEARLDKTALYRTNRAAAKLAIQRAMQGEPSVDELIATRQAEQHN
ncbi:MAG: aldehyde-activating protein [Methylococcaceae bacterium]|nr:MAG: aldehyde-activating protein [Methylococcaceae bacterium]